MKNTYKAALAKLERAGIPPDDLLSFIAAKRDLVITNEAKEKLKSNLIAADTLAQHCENSCKRLRKWRLEDEAEWPWPGVPPSVVDHMCEKFPTAPGIGSWMPGPDRLGKALDALESLANEKREEARAIGEWLRRWGRPGSRASVVAEIVDWILWCNPDFHSWPALVDVLAIPGIDEAKLRKIAAPIRKKIVPQIKEVERVTSMPWQEWRQGLYNHIASDPRIRWQVPQRRKKNGDRTNAFH